MTVRFTPDLYRNGCPVELAEECARVSVRYRDRGIVALGIGGYEPGYPLAPYARAVEIARDGGLGFVPHAGEAAGPESVREALDLGADRIRHGIRAAESAELLTEIAERGIVLDVCPTSNLRTGVVPDLAAHPLPALHAADEHDFDHLLAPLRMPPGSPGRCATLVRRVGSPVWRRSPADRRMSMTLPRFSLADIAPRRS